MGHESVVGRDLPRDVDHPVGPVLPPHDAASIAHGNELELVWPALVQGNARLPRRVRALLGAAHVAQGNPALRVPQPEAWLVAYQKQALALTAHVLGGEENSHCVGDIKRRTR